LIKTEKEYSQSKLGKQGNISLLSEEAGKTGAVNSALYTKNEKQVGK